ncbi:ABC transporter ATP-binding protein [Spirochaeta dissipatitropha]
MILINIYKEGIVFSILKKFWPFSREYRANLMIASLSMLFLDSVMYLIPIGIAYATDHIFPNIRDEGMLLQLFWITLIILLAGVFRGAVAHVMIRNFWRSAEGTVKNIRNAMYEKFQHLDISFYDTAQVGDLMSRATYDLQLVRNFFAFGIEHRIRIVLVTVTVLAFMLWQDWRLALLVYGILPVMFALVLYFSAVMKQAVKQRQKQMGNLNTRLQENIAGIRVVKSFAMEKQEIQYFDRENSLMLQKDSAVALLQVNLNSILLLTDGIGSLLILLFGGYMVIEGTMSLGVLLAFFGYLSVISMPVLLLSFNTSLINQAKGAAVRILEILNSPDQQRFNCGSLAADIEGRLSFDKVSFSYTDGSPILRDVSFTIEPGEHVALFGLTGAGKSTLISLIPRFYMPDSGSIQLDNAPIEDWDMHYLRSRIGTVLQETFLFSASVSENIAFGKPGASMSEIQEVAKHAQIHDFIESLPEGYDTMIGEYGAGLSGGQKQRIAIARTLLQDPKLLILDDCTSSLDALTERKIQQQLRLLMQGRTTIIIAQRISTLALADRIIVLDNGAVKAIDSHDGLLKNNELYRSIFESQTVFRGSAI